MRVRSWVVVTVTVAAAAVVSCRRDGAVQPPAATAEGPRWNGAMVRVGADVPDREG